MKWEYAEWCFHFLFNIIEPDFSIWALECAKVRKSVQIFISKDFLRKFRGFYRKTERKSWIFCCKNKYPYKLLRSKLVLKICQSVNRKKMTQEAQIAFFSFFTKEERKKNKKRYSIFNYENRETYKIYAFTINNDFCHISKVNYVWRLQIYLFSY